jgi:hypothetical protein
MNTTTVERVKKKINDKFGSVNRFCRITNTNYLEVVNIFRKSEGREKEAQLRELAKVVRETNDEPIKDKELRPVLLDQIREAILKKSGTQSAFCEKYGFGATWLSALLSGKHKLLSTRVKDLCKILKIEL